jgi:anti-sigma factor RsiW
MKNFRDIEQLSSYLDGQLSPSESARLESRIASDPELASAFNDIRAARGILRKLPSRKAPRNFTLTRQMVGLKPPLPRSYSFFRFSTAFTTILLVLTFAANALTQLPRMSLAAGGAPAPSVQGAYGMGGGPAATEAPAAAPAIAAVTATPASSEAPMAAAPSVENTAAPTQESLPTTSADATTVQPPMAKEGVHLPESQNQPPVNAERGVIVPVAWQVTLLILGLISGLIMLALRRSAKQKWK